MLCAQPFQSCLILWDPMGCSLPGSYVHGILQARIWSGGHFLLQGIFPDQGSNPGLLYHRQILYHWTTWGNASLKVFGDCKSITNNNLWWVRQVTASVETVFCSATVTKGTVVLGKFTKDPFIFTTGWCTGIL